LTIEDCGFFIFRFQSLDFLIRFLPVSDFLPALKDEASFDLFN